MKEGVRLMGELP